MKQFRKVHWSVWGFNNGMTRETAVWDDGQMLEEAQAYFESQYPGKRISIRRSKINNKSAFVGTI